ncbi:hypothetical protein NQ318_004382 [Aromia moschata]|uniref:Uncharacterized protein n=1 Tax=Aromia moschata TaxID=1265417 RepID=A0AAV8YQ65_9CUCU|nr:hypothetical protein NQ318_004382 [Aromia moschata]
MFQSLTVYLLPTILILVLVRKYRESKWGKCKNKVKLDGKIAIVTGANSGIGFEIAKELAFRNAQVILACRNLEKAREACDLIKTSFPEKTNITVIPMELDLASLYSVKNFTDRIKKQYTEINLLINNAGVSFPSNKRVETKDGFELLELLSKSSSRIVVVSSSLHERGEINLNDLNGLRATKKTNLYANSKLANAYFSQELAKHTKTKNVKVYCCCPAGCIQGCSGTRLSGTTTF